MIELSHDPALCQLAACGLCDAYGQGYAAGKAKLADKVRWTLRDKRGHAAGCGCTPCVLITDVLEAALTGLPTWTGPRRCGLSSDIDTRTLGAPVAQ